MADPFVEWFEAHLPLKGERHAVEWLEPRSFDWGNGLVGRLRLVFFDDDGGLASIMEGDVHLIRGEDLGVDMDVVHKALEGWAQRIRALPPEEARALGLGAAPAAGDQAP